MSAEIHFADWSIHYPEQFDDESVAHVLEPFTDVNHDWDAFPWHLTERLIELLENPAPTFEYLHVTWFFLARAIMLAIHEDALHQEDVRRALREQRVQCGGIYREHVLRRVRAFLRKRRMAALPDCDWKQFDLFDEPEVADKNRGLLLRIFRAAEHDYLQTLNFISLTTNTNERVAGQSAGFWVKGADMPEAEGAAARIREVKGGYVLLPPQTEAKRSIAAGGRGDGIVVMKRGPKGAMSRKGRGPRGKKEAGSVAASNSESVSGAEKRRGKRGESAQAVKVAQKTLAPVVKIFEKAILAATPPHQRMWWQNLRERYSREPGPRETDKWLGVAKTVVAAAIGENRKPARERHSDYVTPLMLVRLLAKLNAAGASRAAIEADYADTLRRCVTREEQKAVNN